jgi:hypothetical protein
MDHHAAIDPRDLLDSADFVTGARVGAVAAVAALIAASAWRAWRGRRLPAGGLVFAAAALVALDGRFELPPELLIGTAALGLAGLTGDLFRVPVWIRAPLALPGAWLVGFGTEVNDVRWTQALVSATAVVGGTLMSDFDRRWRRPSIAGGLFAIAVLGVYVTVPDTEAPLRVLVAAVLIGALGWPIGVLRFGSGGAYAACGVLAWTAAIGGIGRSGSIVGAVASLGLLLSEPVARVIARFRGPLVRDPRLMATLAMGIAQVGLVAVTARVAGLRRDEGEAGVIAAIALVAAVVACVVVARVNRRRRRSQSTAVSS